MGRRLPNRSHFQNRKIRLHRSRRGGRICPTEEMLQALAGSLVRIRARPIIVPCPRMNLPLLRILDANFNRAREALRTVEDYARFVLDNASLSGELKQLRHDLSAATVR